MIMAMGRDVTEKQPPTYSRLMSCEILLRRQPSRSPRQRPQPIHSRSGMSCLRTCVTPSANRVTENWKSFVRQRSMRQNGDEDSGGVLGQNSTPSSRPPSDLVTKRSPPTDKRRQVNIAEVPLTRGQVNAVRAAFKAGITPSRIARQFGISQANVRRALASAEPRR